MGNRPVIFIGNRRTYPEYQERWSKWVREVYWPFLMKSPWVKEIGIYYIVKESPEYNRSMTVVRFDNLNYVDRFMQEQITIDIFKDIVTTWESRADRIWQVVYELVKSFRKEQIMTSKFSETPTVESAPVIHMEGHRLSPDLEERLDNWFTRWGYDVYVPLLMKLPGLHDYSLYKMVDYDFPDFMPAPKTPVVYPPSLSILTFENYRAFENYEKSLELAAYSSCLAAYFPKGLDFRWYVQYRLSQSWRK